MNLMYSIYYSYTICFHFLLLLSIFSKISVAGFESTHWTALFWSYSRTPRTPRGSLLVSLVVWLPDVICCFPTSKHTRRPAVSWRTSDPDSLLQRYHEIQYIVTSVFIIDDFYHFSLSFHKITKQNQNCDCDDLQLWGSLSRLSSAVLLKAVRVFIHSDNDPDQHSRDTWNNTVHNIRAADFNVLIRYWLLHYFSLTGW